MEDRQTPFRFRVLYAVILLVFCFFLCCYSIIMASLSFAISDTKISLETSLQRENKQRYEYSQVAEAMPVARQSLNELLPLADRYTAEVNDLKAKRKKLRAEKQALLDHQSEGGDPE